MAANTSAVRGAVHNVSQAGVGTVDLVTFSRPGNTLWCYNRGADDLTILLTHPGKTRPTAPAALGADTLLCPAGQTKTWRIPAGVSEVQVVSGAAMVYDFELL